MAFVRFDTLWKSHPSVNGPEAPCSGRNGEPLFSNQCAIRVGVALAKCGVDTTKIPGAEHCWHHDQSAGHILRAEQLANGLHKANIAGVKTGIGVKPDAIADQLRGKTGIIYFEDYWLRNGETTRNRSGDHIDLWNGTRLTTLSSFFRIQWGVSIEGIWSDFARSKRVVFWGVQ
jgi:hypothetical protein